MKAASTPEKQARSRGQALLAGIIRCGCCDHAMYATWTYRHGKVYRYYVCVKAAKSGYDACTVKTVSAGEIEGAVVNQLRGIFHSPEMVAQTYRAAVRLAGDEENEEVAGVVPPTEQEVGDALAKLDPVWEDLFPLERQRIVSQLVEKVTVYDGDLDISMRADGLHTLIAELRGGSANNVDAEESLQEVLA